MRFPLLFVLAFGAAAIPAVSQDPHRSARTLPGFDPRAVARQYELELEAATHISTERARKLSREFTKEVHVAGTPAEARTRDLVARYLREAGLDVVIDTFHVYLPHPTKVQLYRLAPDSTELSLIEHPIESDPASHLTPFPAANGYSAAGDVSGEIVYANYGLIQDYATLDSLGVSVKGKIVVARYGRSYRGIKAREAERNGAIALVLYSDPAEDGYVHGDVYPDGPMRPRHGIQRGSVYNDNGDPTTPNYPSLPGAPRIDPRDAAIPKIPVIPISYGNAQALLEHVRGTTPLPAGWQGGLPFRYHIGPGPARARVVVETDEATNAYKDIWNVRAIIPGSEFPNEVIVIGGHRDAWGPGGADNVSGTVSVLEMARLLGELVKQGYQPKRTIMFASWDGEEWGLLGSTEYVEMDTARLSRFGVAYINQDMVAFGPSLGGTASPSLRPLFRDVTKRVSSPDGYGTVYDAWLRDFRASRRIAADTTQPVLGDPGGGSDFAPFYNHLGVPMIEWGFGSRQGIYHSHYDSYTWVEKYGDPTFAYHATAALLGATTILRLANADILPYDYIEYAHAMRIIADEVAQLLTARGWTHIGVHDLTAAIGRMEAAAVAFTMARDIALRKSITTDEKRTVNEALISVERAFVRSEGLHGRPWFRNVIYAADADNGYTNMPFPTIKEAIRAGDQERTIKEIADLVARFNIATEILSKTAQRLQ